MIDKQNLDIRTITMGISLRGCADPNPAACCRKIYDRIVKCAENLVKTGEDIESEFGIPIVNKRIAVTPISIVAESCRTDDFVPFAQAMDDAAREVGVNFIGGFTALVHKGMTPGDMRLIESIPAALAATQRVCSSVNVATTRAGINMDAVARMGHIIKKARSSSPIPAAWPAPSCCVLPTPWRITFMAGAFHGIGEPDCCINVGVSAPASCTTRWRR